MKKISFVVVTYNNKDLLIKCVENLIGIYENMEIIVVDNGSSDGSSQIIEESYADKVILIKTQNNGLAVGNNLGTKASSGEYIIYLGSDAYPDKNAITKIYEFMEKNSQVGICTPRLVLRDGTIDWDAHRGLMTPWSTFTHFAHLDRIFKKSQIFNGYFMGYLDMKSPHEIDACISHFMMVRRGVYNEIKGWDEDYFLFGEDIDFCYMVKKHGYKIMYLGNIEVLHYKGATIGRKSSSDINSVSRKSYESRKKILNESTRAMWLFVNKHYKDMYPLPLIWLMYLGMFLLKILRNTIFEIKYRVFNNI